MWNKTEQKNNTLSSIALEIHNDRSILQYSFLLHFTNPNTNNNDLIQNGYYWAILNLQSVSLLEQQLLAKDMIFIADGKKRSSWRSQPVWNCCYRPGYRFRLSTLKNRVVLLGV